MAIFDRYVTVDWSAACRPCAGKDSVWICSLGVDGCRARNPSTRGNAVAMMLELLSESAARRERVLAGFDFPYGYPAGLAAGLGLNGPAWRAIWDLLAAEVADDPDTNVNNRFEVADDLNCRLGRQATFWGRPPSRRYEHLQAGRTVTYRADGTTSGIGQWRGVEELLRSQRRWPQPAWKLLGAGSVGGQSLTGIPVVARLRFASALKAVSRVWPFEPIPIDLLARGPAIVHAEVWPSLYPDFRQASGACKDEQQVRHLAWKLRSLDHADILRDMMSSLPPQSREEGWILGVERRAMPATALGSA